MTGFSDIVNAFEQNLSSVGIATLVMCSHEEVTRFIVSQVNTDKGIDLIGRLKRRISPSSPIILVAVVSAIPGIESRMSYSGNG